MRPPHPMPNGTPLSDPINQGKVFANYAPHAQLSPSEAFPYRVAAELCIKLLLPPYIPTIRSDSRTITIAKYGRVSSIEK